MIYNGGPWDFYSQTGAMYARRYQGHMCASDKPRCNCQKRMCTECFPLGPDETEEERYFLVHHGMDREAYRKWKARGISPRTR